MKNAVPMQLGLIAVSEFNNLNIKKYQPRRERRYSEEQESGGTLAASDEILSNRYIKCFVSQVILN